MDWIAANRPLVTTGETVGDLQREIERLADEIPAEAPVRFFVRQSKARLLV